MGKLKPRRFELNNYGGWKERAPCSPHKGASIGSLPITATNLFIAGTSTGR